MSSTAEQPMSSSLYPTPTRVNLLQDVADGLIMAEPSSETIWRDERLAGFYDPFTATRTRVTAKARELEEVEWIQLGAAYAYRLTDEGRAVLAAAVAKAVTAR
jgi:hypothetical protein